MDVSGVRYRLGSQAVFLSGAKVLSNFSTPQAIQKLEEGGEEILRNAYATFYSGVHADATR
jgi:hypothetical protein